MNRGRRRFVIGSLAGCCFLQLKGAAWAGQQIGVGLKDLFRHDFKIGTALSSASFVRQDDALLALVTREFNAITAENAMKWQPINPEEGRWKWNNADQFVDFGQRNNMYIVGHNLVWHSQTPSWVFSDKGQVVSPAMLRKRMEAHIATLVNRYKGRSAAWYVFN